MACYLIAVGLGIFFSYCLCKGWDETATLLPFLTVYFGVIISIKASLDYGWYHFFLCFLLGTGSAFLAKKIFNGMSIEPNINEGKIQRLTLRPQL